MNSDGAHARSLGRFTDHSIQTSWEQHVNIVAADCPNKQPAKKQTMLQIIKLNLCFTFTYVLLSKKKLAIFFNRVDCVAQHK